MWAVGERGTLLQSNGDGKHWHQVKAEIPRVSLNGIAFGKDGFGLVVGNRGVVLRTEDGGMTWKRIKIVSQAPAKDLVRAAMRQAAIWVVKKRAVILAGIILVTILFSYLALKIEMYTAFADLLPKNHPYIQVHNQFWKTFGGANVVLLSVQVTDGDIFNPTVLEKIKKLTEIIERTPGANNYQIFSMARQKVKDVRATAWGIEVQPVMWPNVPRNAEEIERLRNIVYANPTIVGRLVSEDGKAALISAAFHEERLDYAALFQRIQAGDQGIGGWQHPRLRRRRADSLRLDLPSPARHLADHRAHLLEHPGGADSLLPQF